MMKSDMEWGERRKHMIQGAISTFLYTVMMLSLILMVVSGVGVKYLVENHRLFENNEIMRVNLKLKFQKEMAQRIVDLHREEHSWERINQFAEKNGITYAAYSVYTGKRLNSTLAEENESRAYVHKLKPGYRIYTYLDQDKITWNSFSYAYQYIFTIIRYQKLLIPSCLGSVCLAILCMLGLRNVAWKYKEQKKQVLPVEGAILAAILACGFGIRKVGYYSDYFTVTAKNAVEVMDDWVLVNIGICLSPMICLALWYCNSFGGWKNMYRYSVFGILIKRYRKLSAAKQLLFLFLTIQLAEFAILIQAVHFSRARLFFLFGVEKLIVLLFCMRHIWAFGTLENATKKIAEGELEHRVNISSLPYIFRQYGQSINEVAGGVSIAVDEKMKSERLKTELITNVSHDIKTPLTSIINFSDLIYKEKVENPKVEEYAKLLHNQSIRLKKLLEDLLEASKAATGNINVKMELCDVRVLLGQCLGEYAAKLEEQGLELVIRQVDEPTRIMADTKLLWRIFDNLMSNICKYSQEKTRVYLSTQKDEKYVYITFKNISKYVLDVETEDLLERFVRGDLSRHTEGHGLGLSVVKSLMDLQGDYVEIAVDGDLFKVMLRFENCEER